MKARAAPRISVLITVAAVALVLTASALGFWQLGRAQQKLDHQATVDRRQALAPVSWSDALVDMGSAPWDVLYERPVSIRGRWLPESTYFLNNRPMAGRTGFIVVSVLMPEGSAQGLLVQRGWVARQFNDLTAVPDVPLPEGWVEIKGRLTAPPSKLFELGQDDMGRVRQNVDIDQLGQSLGVAMVPLSVLQSSPSGEDDNLLRAWPVIGADVHKHYGYAFQWFGLGALTLGLYVWFQILAPRRRQAQQSSR